MCVVHIAKGSAAGIIIFKRRAVLAPRFVKKPLTIYFIFIGYIRITAYQDKKYTEKKTENLVFTIFILLFYSIVSLTYYIPFIRSK